MSHNRQLFWKELPTSEEVEDLLVLYHHHLQDEINSSSSVNCDIISRS